MAANLVNAKQPRPTVPGYVGLSEAIGTAITKVLQGQGEPSRRSTRPPSSRDQALGG